MLHVKVHKANGHDIKVGGQVAKETVERYPSLTIWVYLCIELIDNVRSAWTQRGGMECFAF